MENCTLHLVFYKYMLKEHYKLHRIIGVLSEMFLFVVVPQAFSYILFDLFMSFDMEFHVLCMWLLLVSFKLL